MKEAIFHPEARVEMNESFDFYEARLAGNLPEAHRKIVKIGKSHTPPYKGGSEAIDVQVLFEGVIELLPVYEEIEDGAEIMSAERSRTLKSVRKLAKTPNQFRQDKSAAQQTAARKRVKKRGA